MRGITLLAAVLMAATAQAETFGPGTHVVNGLIVQVPAGASVTISAPTSVVTIGVDPVTPGPPTPGTITEAVAAATAAVPEYALKEQHQRALAFTLTFLGQAVPNTATSSAEARAMMRKAGDAALSADASKWAVWWSTVDAKTATLTSGQYKAALPEITAGLTDGLANAGSTDAGAYGVQEFGLPDGFLAELFKMLLPILLQMLTQLFNS